VGVPLIVSGPGIPVNKRIEEFCYLLDVYPTLADLAGVPAIPEVDGRSLVGVFHGENAGPRPVLFTAYRDSQRAVRDQRWKLIRYPLVDFTQLFDLKNDPYETKNLAEDPRSSQTLKHLMAMLAAQQKEWGDVAPYSVQSPRPARWVPPASNIK
jgi:arylsulfatase A-like enzyme